MRAVQLTSLVKDPEELHVRELPDPVPLEDEYGIEVHASSINFFDTLQIRGKYQNQPALPLIAGFEFSGVVLSIPNPGKSRFNVGDRVFGATQGAYATKICAKESHLQPIPHGWSFLEAATLYLTGPTSFAALTLRGQLQHGEWCLIHGAAGGVGLSALQIAKAKGARVIATASSARDMNVCRMYGADYVIDYAQFPSWEKNVMELTAGHGVDVIFDPVGVTSQNIKCTAFSGRIVCIGFVAGNIESVKVNRILLKNIAVVGLHWGAYSQHDPDTVSKTWTELFCLIQQGKFKPTVYQGSTFIGLDSVPRAMKTLERKESWGKVVVQVSKPFSSSI